MYTTNKTKTVFYAHDGRPSETETKTTEEVTTTVTTVSAQGKLMDARESTYTRSVANSDEQGELAGQFTEMLESGWDLQRIAWDLSPIKEMTETVQMINEAASEDKADWQKIVDKLSEYAPPNVKYENFIDMVKKTAKIRD